MAAVVTEFERSLRNPTLRRVSLAIGSLFVVLQAKVLQEETLHEFEYIRPFNRSYPG